MFYLPLLYHFLKYWVTRGWTTTHTLTCRQHFNVTAGGSGTQRLTYSTISYFIKSITCFLSVKSYSVVTCNRYIWGVKRQHIALKWSTYLKKHQNSLLR